MKLKLELEHIDLNNVDFNNICRFCLSGDGILISIFNSKDAYILDLSYQIKTVISSELEENDGLPSLICHNCLFNFERSILFKKQCENADALLRSKIADPEFHQKTINPANQQSYVSSETQFSEDISGEDNNSENLNINIGEGEPATEKGEELEELHEISADSNIGEHQKSEENTVGDDTARPAENNSVLQMEEKLNDIEEGMYGSKPFSLDLCSVRLQSEGEEAVVNPTSQLTDEEQWSDSGTDLSDDLDVIESSTAGNCSGCNKAFSSPSELERHQTIHKQEPPYPCDYCDQQFEEKMLLKAHWRGHAGHKAHMCLTCGEAYMDRSDLVKHFALHDVIKPFHCPSCGKAFVYRSDLRKHAIIHTGARPFKCPVCHKTFTRSTNLNKHARVHTGRRPYPCNHCDKMFSSRGDLVRHAVIHTGEKPYACSICSLAFNRKDKLARHERVHMTDRPFLCTECPTSFHRKEELTKHSRFHHFKPDPDYYTPSLE